MESGAVGKGKIPSVPFPSLFRSHSITMKHEAWIEWTKGKGTEFGITERLLCEEWAAMWKEKWKRNKARIHSVRLSFVPFPMLFYAAHSFFTHITPGPSCRLGEKGEKGGELNGNKGRNEL